MHNLQIDVNQNLHDWSGDELEPSGSKNRYGAIGGMIRDVTSGMIAWPRCRGLEGKIMAKI